MNDFNKLLTESWCLNNKYFNCYKRIISNAISRGSSNTQNKENHHIIPRSFGGADTVILTTREHFIVHMLLPKFTEGKNKAKMYCAIFRMMTGRQNKYHKLTSRQYEFVRERYRESRRLLQTGKIFSKETCQKISERQKGKTVSVAARKKISIANTGRLIGFKHPKEFGEKISRSLRGRKKSKEWVDKINKNPLKIEKTANKHRGMKRSDESKLRMSLAKIGKQPHNVGKKYYYNPLTNEKLLCFPNDAPEGFKNGFLSKH